MLRIRPRLSGSVLYIIFYIIYMWVFAEYLSRPYLVSPFFTILYTQLPICADGFSIDFNRDLHNRTHFLKINKQNLKLRLKKIVNSNLYSRKKYIFFKNFLEVRYIFERFHLTFRYIIILFDLIKKRYLKIEWMNQEVCVFFLCSASLRTCSLRRKWCNAILV